VQKRALERFEDSAPVSGDASLSVSPKHLVRLWGDEEDKDVGGFLDAEIRAERSMGVERLGDHGHVPGESPFPLRHSLAECFVGPCRFVGDDDQRSRPLVDIRDHGDEEFHGLLTVAFRQRRLELGTLGDWDRLIVASGSDPDHLHEEIELRGERQIGRSFRDLRIVGDLAHRGERVALLDEEPSCGIPDLGARAQGCLLAEGRPVRPLDRSTHWLHTTSDHYSDTAPECPGAGQQQERGRTMHATVVHVNIHDQTEAKRALDQEFIPMLRGASGFVGAYFVAVDETHGVSIQVFESEEQARAAAPPETGPGMGGVKLDTVQFGPVIGAA
jgi:hypothetical protein